MGQDNALRELLPLDQSLISDPLAPIGLGILHSPTSPRRTAIQLALSPVQRVLFAALAVMSLELTIGFGDALAGGDDDDVGGIAERLAMGTRGYLNHLLYRQRKLGGD
jgi:hypothetical protein